MAYRWSLAENDEVWVDEHDEYEWECPSCETDTHGDKCHYCGYSEE